MEKNGCPPYDFIKVCLPKLHSCRNLYIMQLAGINAVAFLDVVSILLFASSMVVRSQTYACKFMRQLVR